MGGGHGGAPREPRGVGGGVAPRTSVDTMATSCREVALELRRLCEGALAGMFDGPTTAGVDSPPRWSSST